MKRLLAVAGVLPFVRYYVESPRWYASAKNGNGKVWTRMPVFSTGHCLHHILAATKLWIVEGWKQI